MEKLTIVFALIIASALAGPLDNVDLPVPSDDVDWRIVGGSNAPDGQYPHQISMRTWPQNRHFCGGSIIGYNWILSAAHCVVGQSASGIAIVVGTNTLNSGGTAYLVSQIIVHEGYSSENNVNDIALVRTSVAISYNSKVKSIALATTVTPGGASLVLSGWGLTSYPSNNIPNNLQHIGLRSITVSQCQAALPGFPVYTTNVCTREPSGRGACQGDSGGPLISGNIQVGVVSWGIPCAKGNPDIFTAVSSFRSWIRGITGI